MEYVAIASHNQSQYSSVVFAIYAIVGTSNSIEASASQEKRLLYMFLDEVPRRSPKLPSFQEGSGNASIQS